VDSNTDDAADQQVDDAINTLLATYPPATTEPVAFLRAQFDAGLGYIQNPVGYGGLALSIDHQRHIDDTLNAAGAPASGRSTNAIAAGQGAASILAFGTEEMKQKYLRPLFTAELMGCQLYSEPGAGSDLASLATRAVRDGDEWIVNGQKVWTSGAHHAKVAILLARTDPDVPKHNGLTQFVLDMTAPGVEVRPLRQMSGGAEFNEVFLHDVRVPDSERLGPVGDGWTVSQHTLVHERYNMPSPPSRGSGAIAGVVDAWQARDDKTSPAAMALKAELMRHWVDIEVLRLLGVRANVLRSQGSSGAEGSLGKLANSVVGRRLADWAPVLLGPEGTILEGGYDKPESMALMRSGRRGPGALQRGAVGSPGIAIAGGTDQIQRNIIGDRVLGLTREPAMDKGVAWSKTLRS
jgi:alkylation response protein AidB-like acyl-CoA dehydrogenase